MKKQRFLNTVSFLTVLAMLFGMMQCALYVGAEGVVGEMTDDDVAVQVPEDDYSYVDFAADIDDSAEFENDSIIVTMKQSETEVNKVYTAEDFPELDVAYIEDLTYLTNEELLNDPEFMANYTQILQIHLNTKTEDAVVDAVDAMSERSTVDVDSAVPNYVMKAENTDMVAPASEPLYGNQSTYMDRINMPAAWNAINAWMNETGESLSTVKVAVLDTGVADHPDLHNNLLDGYDAFNDTDNDFGGDSEDTNTKDVIHNIAQTNKHDHGTSVSGIIGAEVNGIGVTGIALNVKIVPIQFYGSCDENRSFTLKADSFTRAITYLNNNNIPIANYSNSLPYTDSTNISLYTKAINNYFGLFIAAAGNNAISIDSNNVGNLAKYECDNIISVMGTVIDPNVGYKENKHSYLGSDNKPRGSNYSTTYVDIAAPWHSYTVKYFWDTKTYDYGEFNGTSAATPYVAGVAALIKSIRPEIATDDIKNIILNSADASTKKTADGCCINNRFLDAGKAVEFALDYETPTAQTFMEDVDNDGCDDLVYFREYDGKRHFQVFPGSNANHIGLLVTDTDFSEDVTRRSYNTVTNEAFSSNDTAFMGDVNGDGCSDMIIQSVNSSGNRVFTVYPSKGSNDKGKFYIASGYITTKTTIYSHSDPCSVFVDYINNDNFADVLVHYKDTNGTRSNVLFLGNNTGGFYNGVKTTSTVTYASAESEHVFVIDVDGDGDKEVVVHRGTTGQTRKIFVYKFNTAGAFAAPVTVTMGTISAAYRKYAVGNFNGDSYGDFLVTYKNSSGKRANLLYLGNANGTFATTGVTTTFSTDTYRDSDPFFVADVNQNGCDDLVVQWVNTVTNYRQILTYFGTSSGSFSMGANVNTNNIHNTDTMSIGQHIGDVNGAGGLDFVAIVASTSSADRCTAYVNLGTTASGFQGYTFAYKLRTYFHIAY